ncbi:hypothetical protein K439DRAFT_1121287 [Ramaria rubella]|nr:hypothetical protein K439DRAFT_1121287 [Ramaria rubella]
MNHPTGSPTVPQIPTGPPRIPESARSPQPGFQDHPKQWSMEPGRLSPEEQTQLLDYLNQLVKDLDGDDPVRWEEWGIVPDYWPGVIGPPQGRKRTVDDARWRIRLELRWSYPIRLAEGLEHVEWLVRHFESYGNRSVRRQDPTLCVYFAAALEMRGDNDARALALLDPPEELFELGVGPRNQLLARACLSRLFRRAGKEQEAIQEEEEICDWICGHPYTMSPRDVLNQVRVPGETDNRIMDRLGHDHFDGYVELSPTFMVTPHGITVQMASAGNDTPSDVFSFRPLEANKRDKIECWLSGCRASNDLNRCSKCKVALYCSVAHQKKAWPRHKRLCESYNDAHPNQDVKA